MRDGADAAGGDVDAVSGHGARRVRVDLGTVRLCVAAVSGRGDFC